MAEPSAQRLRHTGNKKNSVKKSLFVSAFIIAGITLKAQDVDSIYFHLYTDSLKKGTHNYINVDGKLSNGAWKPLTAKEIQFSSSVCEFSGNELIIPADFKGDKITVKAVLKSNPVIWKEKTIWIKKKPDPEFLPTKEEILKGKPKRKNH
jgi:hypothetical protein